MYKIYLDNCCYNRPFDNQSQTKVHLEALAKLHIQEQIRRQRYQLVWSYILDYENGNNPYTDRRLAIAPWKSLATDVIANENEDILSFAERLASGGIKNYDALHIACAVYARCDYFLTTDKKLLNSPVEQIKIVNPLIFLNEVEGDIDA